MRDIDADILRSENRGSICRGRSIENTKTDTGDRNGTGTVTNAESTGCLSVDAPELVCYNPILDMQRGV